MDQFEGQKEFAIGSFQIIFDTLPNRLLLLKDDLTIVSASAKYLADFGFSLSIVGRNLREILTEKSQMTIIESANSVLKNRKKDQVKVSSYLTTQASEELPENPQILGWKVIHQLIDDEKKASLLLLHEVRAIKKPIQHFSAAPQWLKEKILLERIQYEDEIFLKSLQLQELQKKSASSVKELNDIRTQMHVLEECIPFGIWIADLSGKFIRLSQSFLNMLGFSLSEINRSGLKKRMSVDQFEILKTKWLEKGNSTEWNHEFCIKDKEGEERWILSRGSQILDEHQRPFYWIGIHLDITDRVQTQKCLHDGREIFKQLTENLTNQSIWMKNIGDHQLVFLSSGTELLWEIPLHELLSEKIKFSDFILEEDRSVFEEGLKKQRQGSPTNEKYRIKTPQGHIKWVSESSFPVRDSKGRIYRIAGVTTDITKNREFEIELESARQKAEAANQTKTQFLANMSHEIRTPLGAIIGFCDLLHQEGRLSEEGRSYLDIIKKNGSQLLHIVDDILDISKVESNRLQMELLTFNPIRLIEEVARTLEVQATAKKIELVLHFEGQIPETITSDPTRLKQILSNIIGNAIKFTTVGRVEVCVFAASGLSSHQQGFLFVTVRDTGNGISTEESRRLFKPFVQGDNSIKRKYGGTGLGLALSKNLARAMGGDLILFDSEPGRGSLFLLSVSTGRTQETGSSHSLKLLPEPPPHGEKMLQNTRVLVVDDAPDNRALFSRFLGHAGAIVVCAEDGQEAIRKAKENEFDVVLMDLQMPGVDGFEATCRLRASNYTKPILALTAHAMQGEKEKCIRAGFNDHLTKPVNRMSLINAVKYFSTMNCSLH